MPNLSLTLKKLTTELIDTKAFYYLDSDKSICLNSYLGKKIKIQFNGIIHCLSCRRKIKKSFQQGYCFPCMRKLPECDSCMIKPELCHYSQGTCRNSNWGLKHCFQDHYIYLANTGMLKVGITRQSNIPYRWIDQGATQALTILKVKERLHAGILEVLLKKYIADKTNWRKMLQGEPKMQNLFAKKVEILDKLNKDLHSSPTLFNPDIYDDIQAENSITISYPILAYLPKISSYNLDKNPLVEGSLLGIKGQYLILDTGVINIRKFSGYHCNIHISE